MPMSEIMEVFLNNIAVWIPSLASVCAIIVAIMKLVGQFTAEINKIKGKNDELTKDLEHATDNLMEKYDHLVEEMREVIRQNAELQEVNKKLTNELRHIQED